MSFTPEPEWQRALARWNNTYVDYPSEMLLHTLCDKQAERTPDAIALVFEEQQLTYGELERRANQLARYLYRLGLRPDMHAGICLTRSLEMVIGLLAILKSGGAYLPLDPSYPADRLAFILQDAEISLVLTTRLLSLNRTAAPSQMVYLDSEWVAVARESSEKLCIEVRKEQLAYTIYTSGSTGVPKGVMNTHQAIVNRLLWMQERFAASPADRILQKTPFSFDVSVWEFFWPLLSGATLVLARPAGHQDSAYLVNLIIEQQITLLHFVPAMLRAFLQETGVETCSSLRAVLCSGEALSRDLQDLFYHRLTADLHNLYGPTEAAVDVTHWACQRLSTLQTIPIGRPIANIRLYILDAQLHLLPPGESGELYISGTGLARGYLHRPALTAERFLPDPFASEAGSRMYCTGDLARYVSDGTIEYLGRTDFQVKIRGNRVELAEIEAILSRHGEVQACIVLAREDTSGNKRLIAYIVLHTAYDWPTSNKWREQLAQFLPEYMLPALFIQIPALPLLTNGKIDRAALPLPDEERPDQSQAYVAPRTQLEQQLTQIWQQVLHIEDIGIRDNFFALGGDSILSLQIIARAYQSGLHFTTDSLFAYQTIAELADTLEVTSNATALPAQTSAQNGVVPLTPIQEWFFTHNLTARQHWNQSILLDIPAGWSLPQLQQALQATIELHEVFRLRFFSTAQRWQSRLVPAAGNIPLTQVDLAGLTADCQQSQIRVQAACMQQSFHLEQGPLIAAAIFTPGNGQAHRLLLIAHHLIIDAVSWRMLIDELRQAYQQLLLHRAIDLPSEETPWSAWANALTHLAQSGEILAQLPFWQKQYQRHTSPLPQDTPGGQNQVKHARTVQVVLTEQETWTLLRRVPETYRIRAYEVLLTALAQTLAAWCQSHEILLNLEGHGREKVAETLEVARTVGWFTSLYPLRLQITGQEEAGEALKYVKERVRQVPQKGIGYGLLRYLAPEAEIQEVWQALEQNEVAFNYFGQWDQTFLPGFGLPGTPQGEMRGPEGTRFHLLEIDAMISSGQLLWSWTYSEQVHRRETIEQLAQQCRERLQQLLRYCCTSTDHGYTPADFALDNLTQAGLDRLIDRLHPGLDDIQDIYPLTAMQQGLLLQSQYGQEAGTYHVQMYTEVMQDLDLPAFRRCWEQAMERHTVLRSSIYNDEASAEPLQIVWKQVALPWTFQDWRLETAPQEKLQEYLQEERQQGFATDQAPLWRVQVCFLGQKHYQIIWSFHHVILDGWSFAQIINEIAEAYTASTQGKALPESRNRPYRDYVRWLQKQDLKSAEQFWREELRGFRQATALHTSVAQTEPDRNAQPTTSEHLAEHLDFSEHETAALLELGRTYQLTLSTIIQGMWALLLSRYSGEEDVLFGVVVSGRPGDLPGVERIAGLFINTLPLRLHIKRQLSGIEWLRKVQDKNREIRQYEYSPLIQIQQWSEMAPGHSLFESVFIFENYPGKGSTPEEEPRVLQVKDIRSIERTNYPLTFVALPGPRLSLHLDATTAHFAPEQMRMMLSHLRHLLQELLANPHHALAEFSLLTASERQKMLVTWNTTWQTEDYQRCFHLLFAEKAHQVPDRIALVWEEQSLTYEMLDRCANQLAHYLKRQGVGAEVVVGICMERSIWQIISMLGIMKAGGAYLPLDPAYPQERLTFMSQDAGLALILSQQHLGHRLSGLLAQSLYLDVIWPLILQESQEELPCTTNEHNLAYVIYTSGSSGKPKGVQITHRGVGTMAMAHVEAFEMAATADRVLQFTSFSFDASVYEITVTLLAGATLLLVPQQRLLPDTDLLPVLEEEAITIMSLPPSVLITLPTTRLSALRMIVVGSEACTSELVARWAGERSFFNAYGPTETTVCASIVRCLADGKRPSIGRPIPQTSIYILDTYLQALPPGITGEIYIGGIGLARGYHQRPDLTAEYFLPDPYSSQPGSLMYKTGDIAYYQTDGSIEFLGRIDTQVKLHGQRIEPGEIEATLTRHPNIQKAAVQICEIASGNQALVAYLVPKKAACDIQELRQFLTAYLPGHMVPGFFVPLDSFPATPNGKLDRRALPIPEISGGDTLEKPVDPRNPLEATLVQVWEQILQRPQVSIYDNFFLLGGHSLLAGQLISRVRHHFQVELSLRQIFETPTIAELAEKIAHAPDQEEARRALVPRRPGISLRERRKS